MSSDVINYNSNCHSGLSRRLSTTCLDYFVFPSPEVITDNCNLIDVPTLQRSFEKREAKRVALCLETDGRHFEHLLSFVNTIDTIGAPHNRQVTHNARLYENQDFNVLKNTNLTFTTDI
jgi:hypothetical protein